MPRKRKTTRQWPEIVLGNCAVPPKKDQFGRVIGPSQFNDRSPFCMAFVYAKSGNVTVKGSSKDVHKYLYTERQLGNCIYNSVIWRKGYPRSMWRATPGIGISTEKNKKGRKIFKVLVQIGKLSIELKFRKIPHRWLRVFDKVVGTEAVV